MLPDSSQSGRGGDATIAFQPIFDLETDGKVVFFESNLRITQTPDPVFHIRLLALAEELGFIHHIDMYVLNLTLDTLRENPGMKASVNISQRSIPVLGQLFVNQLAASKLRARLIIEITESTEIPTPWVAAFAAHVREVGCQLAVDDFETGFADETLVRAVKPDLIKVVVDDTTTGSRERIARTVALADEMGAAVVGEKIDSAEKIELMKAAGIRYVQGFALGIPVLSRDLPGVFSRPLAGVFAESTEGAVISGAG